PELAAQVTLQPVERLGVDAAILFADILLPFEPLGLGLSFAAGEGPQITRPIREPGQVLELPPVDPATDLAYVMEAARAAVQALPPHIPLIGFAGAPFTLASYAIEGGATRTFTLTKRFMYAEPRAWHELMQRFAELVGGYLAAQAVAGGLRDLRLSAQPARPRARGRERRAGDPLRHGYGHPARGFRAGGRRCDRRRLARPARRRVGAHRVLPHARHSGQPRSGCAAGAAAGARAAGAGGARPRWRSTRAHLQPRARRPPRDAGGGAAGGRGVGAWRLSVLRCC